MRSHAKAATAGSTRRLGKKSKPALLLCVLAAAVVALALVVGSASGATTRFLVETFGSSAQPSFPADRGMAFDQGASQLYVIDSTNDTISRFDADGSAANFSALGSNVIDGEGTGDETPLGHLAFEANRQREQIALDESGEATDGNVYVTQSAKDVVDIFNGAGEYLGALSESTEGGAFGEPCGVAVDDEGTVYVGDRGDDRIHVFDPAAAVPVNGDSAATSFATLTDPCTLAAGMGATDGFLFVARSTAATLSKLDAATGEVKYEIATGASTVSVDPTTGHVFVARNTGSSSSVDEYDASGAAEATLVSSFKPGSTVEGIALNSAAEQVYVARTSTENVEVFGPAAIVPDVVTQAPTSNSGTRATLAGTVNPDGVELDECFFEWGLGSGSTPYTDTVPCAETPAEIGAGTSPVAVHADLSGLTPQSTNYHYRLAATNPNATINGSNQNFTTPNTVIAEAASGVTSSEATLNGTVNPDTETLSGCVFEWGPQKGQFDEGVQTFPETAPCVPGPGGIGSGEAPVAVEADIGGLDVGTTYVYRLKVTYPAGAAVNPSSPGGETLLTLGPSIDGVWSEDVVRTEATLKADLNPEGKETTYYFEYGTTEAYGSETPEGSAGPGSAAKEVTAFLDGLEPDTTYHYRLVAANADATNEEEDHTFTTYAEVANNTDCPNQVFRTGPSASLPDCRAFEMVSPVDKEGQDAYLTLEGFAPPFEVVPASQSSLDGEGVVYTSYRPFSNPDAAPPFTSHLATRDAGGWSDEAINPPSEGGAVSLGQDGVEYETFSPDLSMSWLRPVSGAPLAPGAAAGQRNLYARSASGQFTAITAAEPNESGEWRPEFSGASDDGSYVAFGLNDKIAPEAAPGITKFNTRQAYVWHEGGIHAVGILPNGETYPGLTQVGGGLGGGLSGSPAGADARVANAVSSDGSRIFWTALAASNNGPLYVREHAEQGAVAGECVEPGKACTIAVSESVAPGPAQYWTATRSGDKVLFTLGLTSATTGPLYLFDVDTEVPTFVAGSTRGVAGASDDLSRIYFASDEDLAAGAIAGEPNLYLYDNGTLTFVGPLAANDARALRNDRNATTVGPTEHAAAVTHSGGSLVFVAASAELAASVGYDNVDVDTGQPANEVYRYEVGDGLSCISCNPSGARPDALAEGFGQVTAAWILPHQLSYHTRRYISDDGRRVFFNSLDALVPEDTNGAQDVYQWEASGKGDCTEAGSSYSVRNGGCISLFSGGQNAEESTFLDASADGDDVFIRTEASLVAKDPGSWDVYDVRTGGGLSQPVTSSECEGDSCQSVPEPPRFPSHASSTFRGAGDPQQRANCGVQARRAVKSSRQAKRLRRAAKRAASTKRKKQLRRRSGKLAQRANRMSTSAKRCRRANRRAGR